MRSAARRQDFRVTDDTLRAIADAQRQGRVCALIASDSLSLNPGHARGLGVRLGELLIAQHDSAADAQELVQTLIGAGVDLVGLGPICLPVAHA